MCQSSCPSYLLFFQTSERNQIIKKMLLQFILRKILLLRAKGVRQKYEIGLAILNAPSRRFLSSTNTNAA